MKKMSMALALVIGAIVVPRVFAQQINQVAAEYPSGADDGTGDNQTINDEGYGNDDTEYYGSKDDLSNEEDTEDFSNSNDN